MNIYLRQKLFLPWKNFKQDLIFIEKVFFMVRDFIRRWVTTFSIQLQTSYFTRSSDKFKKLEPKKWLFLAVHAEPWKLKNTLICQLWHVGRLRLTVQEFANLHSSHMIVLSYLIVFYCRVMNWLVKFLSNHQLLTENTKIYEKYFQIHESCRIQFDRYIIYTCTVYVFF